MYIKEMFRLYSALAEHTLLPSVQIHDDVDAGNKDLSSDEHDNNPFQVFTCGIVRLASRVGDTRGFKQIDLPWVCVN